MEPEALHETSFGRAEELPGAELTHPFGAGWEAWKVRGKVFMLHTMLAGEAIVILKAAPHDARALRDACPDITPGYHMNKQHWITLHPGGNIDPQLVDELVTESYLRVVETLPRGRRPVDPGTFGAPSLTGARLQEIARDAAGALPGVSTGYPFTPHLLVFKVAGRVFLVLTEDPHEEIITVKAEPPHGAALTREHEGIQPGRYLDKRHWVSIGASATLTPSLVDDLVRNSYDLVVARLPASDRQLVHDGAHESRAAPGERGPSTAPDSAM